MNLEVHARESSNYRKHTAANPIQRLLIDRFHEKIVRTVSGLAPRSFLDAGCGEGFVAERILSTMPGLDLTGCDLSAGALAVAKDRIPYARFVSGSVTNLPFPDNSFDMVGCFEVLEHLPNDLPGQALAEFARVARRWVRRSCPSNGWIIRPTPKTGAVAVLPSLPLRPPQPPTIQSYHMNGRWYPGRRSQPPTRRYSRLNEQASARSGSTRDQSSKVAFMIFS